MMIDSMVRIEKIIQKTKAIALHVTSILLVSSFWLFPTGVSTATESKNDLLFGMSTALSGPAADLGHNMRVGVLAGFKRINKDGGIRGRKLQLISLDDGYEPSRTAPNMRKLIEQEQVLAVIGNVGTPTAIAAIPIANEQKTLFFSPFTGAGVLRKSPPDRYVINYRASYAEETGAMIDALINIGQLSPDQIAFFTQRDGYGDAGFVGGIAALKRHGLKEIHGIKHVRYERNTLAVEDALASLLLSTPLPEAVIMVGAYAPCAKFILLAKEAGLDAVFMNVSFVGSTPLARELGQDITKVIVTQVVPHPIEAHIPLVQEYQRDLNAYDSASRPTFGSLEGYISTRILVRALRQIKDSINRESLVDALESLGTFDIGFKHRLHLDHESHQASHKIWPTILKNGTFVSFEWEQMKTVLAR